MKKFKEFKELEDWEINLNKKKLTDKEIEGLFKMSQVTVDFVLNDDSKTEYERIQGRKDLKLIQILKDSWKKDSLDLNFITKVLKTITGNYLKPLVV